MSLLTLQERVTSPSEFTLLEGLRDFDDPTALEEARLAVVEGIVIPGSTLQIPPERLAMGFRSYTKGLGCPEETLNAFDLVQWEIGETDWRITNHGRLVGGLGGAGTRAIGSERFGDPTHEWKARIMEGLHDAGKPQVAYSTLMRTWGQVMGFGAWVDTIDRPNIQIHPEKGAMRLQHIEHLPEGTDLIAGTHHSHQLEGKTPYGMDLSAIDLQYADPYMREWLHFQSKMTTAADEFEAATGRENDYKCHGRVAYESMVVHLQQLFPEQWQVLLAAFHYERSCYLRYTPEIEIEPSAA